MSLSAVMQDEPRRVYAITAIFSRLILFPAENVRWRTKKYYSFNSLFYRLYNERYSDMINMLNEVLFQNLEHRLCKYFLSRKEISGHSIIKIKHREIANELGTAREVISRMLKKLEKEGKIIQHSGKIEIFEKI